jgi:protein transport protein SEC61 subunit gamma-like protein
MNIQETLNKLKGFWHECIRVLKVTKKPTSVEFKSIVKITALGIAIIGLAGFIVFMVRQMIFG